MLNIGNQFGNGIPNRSNFGVYRPLENGLDTVPLSLDREGLGSTSSRAIVIADGTSMASDLLLSKTMRTVTERREGIRRVE